MIRISYKLILSLIKRDFAYGVKRNYLKYVLIAVFFSLINFMQIMRINSIMKINDAKLFYDIFKGIQYGISMNNFQIPLVWYLINCFCAFIIGDYVYYDLKHNGIYTLIRAKKTAYFWTSKIIWAITSIFLFYAILFSITFIFGKIFLMEHSGEVLFGKVQMKTIEFISFSFLLYFTTSAALSLLQISLSLVVKPLYAYFFVIVIFFVSIFINNNLFPGQHSLILRHVPFDNTHDLTLYKSLIYNFILFSFSVLLGHIFINKKDII